MGGNGGNGGNGGQSAKSDETGSSVAVASENAEKVVVKRGGKSGKKRLDIFPFCHCNEHWNEHSPPPPATALKPTRSEQRRQGSCNNNNNNNNNNNPPWRTRETGAGWC